MNIRWFLVSISSLSVITSSYGSLTDFFSVPNKQKILLTEQESKEHELERLRQKKEDFEKQKNEILAKVRQDIQTVENQIHEVQDATEIQGDSEFLTKKLALLNEQYHVLKKTQALLEQLPALMDERIELIETYIQDPDLSEFKESLIRDKCIYSFSYLMKLHQLILNKKKTLAAVEEQESIAKTDLENRKRSAQDTQKEYKKLKQSRENNKREIDSDDLLITNEHRAQLQVLEDTLFDNKERLDELRIQESQQLVELNKGKKFVNKLQLGILESTLRQLKPQIRVGEAELSYTKNDLEEARQLSYTIKREYDQKIDRLDLEEKERQKELQLLSENFKIKSGAELDEWAQEPQKTVESHEALCLAGLLNSKILFLQRQKDLLKMRLASEDEAIRAKEINSMVQETFHKIQSGKFATDEALNQELKRYSQLAASIKGALSFYQGQSTIAETLLKSQKRAIVNLADRLQQLKKLEFTLFKSYGAKYQACSKALQEAEEISLQAIDIIGQLKNGYSDIGAKLDGTLQLIEFISNELSQITIWHRPEHAVSWEGIKNIFSDIKSFIGDLNSSILQIDSRVITKYFKKHFSHIEAIIVFILQLLALCIILFVIRLYLPALEKIFLAFGKKHAGAQFISFILAAFVGCIINSFIWLSIAIFALFFVHIYLPADAQLYMMLYLIAIPYLIYVASKWVYYITRFNKEHDYCFLGKDFQDRFFIVFSTFLYATITIWFFREAFILGGYRRSELPTILLAINFIILQISLISLISKDQILNLIPKSTDIWTMIHALVDRYYYLLFLGVIAIIIMSNPYVGFGRLVLYILRRVVYTTALLAALIWAHQLFRRIVSHLFFYTENEITKERFSYAKTWYGAAVIILFSMFSIVGIILISKIWGWPEWFANINSWSDFEYILKRPLGDYNEISLWTILTIVFYALGGILISYAFDRFVLGKIFDILLVDSGVQNTIARISHYIIFLTALILGFNAVGLGTLVGWLVGALAVSIGFVIKDPIGDFVAYFIILVQRPIKIGDYIQLDNDLGGVVRRITPRSVVLRRKNSTTVILPNSEIIRRPIFNWNYTRGFIAFNDIKVVIAYSSDPVQSRALMHQVLSENQSILKNPRPIVRLDNLGSQGYEFTVRGYLSSSYTLDQWDIASDVRMSIVRTFADNGIKLGVPIRLLIKQANETPEDLLFEVENKQ